MCKGIKNIGYFQNNTGSDPKWVFVSIFPHLGKNDYFCGLSK